jgi:YVTN family beta-propeller protein
MAVSQEGVNFKDAHDLSDLKKYYKNSHLVIIGISKYKEEIPLTNARNDATAIMNILEEKYGFKCLISPLFDENATDENIRHIFSAYILENPDLIGPRDRVLVYYSGHGKLRPYVDFKGQGREEAFIIPYDTKLNTYYKNIPMKSIKESCQKCMAKHVLLILDCCYSGFASIRAAEPERPKKITSKYVEKIAARRAVQVLAAGQKDEPVSDSGVRLGCSAFTGELTRILEFEEDIDKKGILTASQIGENIVQRVVEQEGSFQMPAYDRLPSDNQGDFIFKIFKNITPPEAHNVVIETESTKPVQITLKGTDPDPADILEFTVIARPQHGTLTGEANRGIMVYVADAQFVGKDSFSYKVTDGQGEDSNIASVTVMVNALPPQDHPPVVCDKKVQTDAGIPLQIILTGKDPNPKDKLEVHVVDLPKYGILTLGATPNSFVYTPNTIVRGIDSFTYKATDAQGTDSNIATVTITTKSPAHPPDADNKEAHTEASIPVEIRLTGSDPDPEDILKFSIIDPPQHGTLKADTRTNSIVYTPSMEFIGIDNFTYRATDKLESDSNVATVTITVKPKSFPPAPPIPTPKIRNPKIFIPILAAIVSIVVGVAIISVHSFTTTTTTTTATQPTTTTTTPPPTITNQSTTTTTTPPPTITNQSTTTTTTPPPTVVATIAVGKFPNEISVNPSTNIAYVANEFSSTVSVIDGKTNTVTATFKVRGSAGAISVNPSTNMVYVVSGDFNKNVVSVIDGKTNTLTATIKVGTDRRALLTGISVNPSTNMVYVTNSDSNTVSVIDGETNTVTATIPVGSSPNGLSINPSTNKV